jgi:RecB family endonuclease NucS
MTRTTKAGIAWNGLLQCLTDCIGAWKPPLYGKETEYSRALAEYLRLSLPVDAHVECEYRHLGETIDIFVRHRGVLANGEVFIEVKRRLNRKSELNRLVGQVMSLAPGKNRLLVVLIGECDVELVGRLKHQFKEQLEQGPFITDLPTMSVVHVPEPVAVRS